MIKAGRTDGRRQRARGGANVTEGQGEDDATEGQEPPPDDKTENDAAKIYTVIYLLCNLPWPLPHVAALAACGCPGYMWVPWLHVVDLAACGYLVCIWLHCLHVVAVAAWIAVAARGCRRCMSLPWRHVLALAA